ncbi:hypothetical protein D918_09012 [Trichuris suis]|nr:hypothetical protein D918_09012 [Trichuris suis]
MKALQRMVEYTLKFSLLLLILSAGFCEQPPEDDEADDHENEFDWFWPQGVIPYEIIDTKSNATAEVIETAMGLLENETCVRFLRLNGSSSYSHYVSIHVTDGIMCDATVGRQQSGVSTVWLHRKKCLQVGMILHQLMHVIGFYHENERPDRDFFVTVYWNNIRPEKRHLFKTRSWREFPVTTPYDYESITHLGSTAFSRAGRVTLEPLRAVWTMGQRTKLSDGDILKVNIIYQCQQEKECRDTLPRLRCLNEGVQEMACNDTVWAQLRCAETCGYCRPFQSMEKLCEDKNLLCKHWAKQGICNGRAPARYREEIIAEWCPRSCHRC